MKKLNVSVYNLITLQIITHKNKSNNSKNLFLRLFINTSTLWRRYKNYIEENYIFCWIKSTINYKSERKPKLLAYLSINISRVQCYVIQRCISNSYRCRYKNIWRLQEYLRFVFTHNSPFPLDSFQVYEIYERNKKDFYMPC